MPSATEQATMQSLLEARNKAITECRKIVDTAAADGRTELNADEQTAFNKWETEAKAKKAELETKQKNADRMKWLEDEEATLDEPVGDRQTDRASHQGNRRETESRIIKWQTNNKLRHTVRQFNTSPVRGSAGYASGFNRYLAGVNPEVAFKDFDAGDYEARNESQTMQSDIEEKGGYFVASETFVSELLKNVDDQTFVQGLARMFVVRNARALGVRKRTTKYRAWDWGSELHDVTEHLGSVKYGKRVLTPHYITGAARISRDLMRSAMMPVDSMVLEESSIDLAETLEQAYLYADGNEKPLGVMVASSEGISTARDVTTAAGQTSTFDFDTFLKAKYKLKKQYRNRARWMLHRDHLLKAAMIKDSTGQYIWQPSKVVGDPDTILGLGLDESEWMPNTAAASNYFALLADWSYYWIAFALELEVLRLNEIRARNNEVEYIMRAKVDAMPILEEAFVRLQFAAA